MLPGNVDPRRPDKVQRYVPKTNNANGQEDLTTDYMNILGQHPTTANASEASDKHAESSVSTEANTNQVHGAIEETHQVVNDDITLATNMIPTSSQYGVAFIPNPTPPTDGETNTPSSETVTDAIMKPSDDAKDLHSTPSRNDRFKVVKIASLEPFKRGRWKCMDYVDDPTPVTSQSKIPQSQGSIQVAPGGVYLQTQSLPQQQIQQMLLQSGFTNGTPFFSNMPAQIVQPGQYFYPQVSTLQNQTLPAQQQVPTSMPIQFNTGQTYFPAGVIQNAAGFTATVPSGYTNVQYIPANLVQNQNSAFVPTSQQTVQLPANFQQSQTYAGQPNVSQSNVPTQQPMVNGHAYPQQNEPQNTAPASLPSQTAKNVILNNSLQTQQSVVSQNQINQQQNNTVPNQMVTVTGNTQTQAVATVQTQQPPQQQQQQQNYQQNTFQQQVTNQQTQNTNNPVQVSPNLASVVQAPTIIQVSQVMPPQNFDQNLANNVYTNPQFTMSVNSLTVLDNNDASVDAINETSGGGGSGGGGAEATSENTDDVAKTNPVVNAIDNKIEQAMDLVKSHLMYTVREEVEVLKEKITELLDRIQQLENENNYLRQQLPKNQNITIPTAISTSNTSTTSQSSLPITNPSSNLTTQTTTAAPAVASTTPSPNPITNVTTKASIEPPTQQ